MVLMTSCIELSRNGWFRPNWSWNYPGRHPAYTPVYYQYSSRSCSVAHNHLLLASIFVMSGLHHPFVQSVWSSPISLTPGTAMKLSQFQTIWWGLGKDLGRSHTHRWGDSSKTIPPYWKEPPHLPPCIEMWQNITPAGGRGRYYYSCFIHSRMRVEVPSVKKWCGNETSMKLVPFLTSH